MKKNVFIMLVITIFVFRIQAQDVQFPPSIISAGGGAVNTSHDHISKWRIGSVNVFYIKTEDLKSGEINSQVGRAPKEAFNVSAYPNPVTDLLNVQFIIENPNVFSIEVTDVSGRKVLIKQKNFVLPNQIIQLDLSKLTPALYHVNAYSESKEIRKVFKINKQ